MGAIIIPTLQLGKLKPGEVVQHLFTGAVGQLLTHAPSSFRGWNKSWREISTPAFLAGMRFTTMTRPTCSKGSSGSSRRLCSLRSTFRPSLWCPVSVPQPLAFGEKSIRWPGVKRSSGGKTELPVPCDLELMGRKCEWVHMCACVCTRVCMCVASIGCVRVCSVMCVYVCRICT